MRKEKMVVLQLGSNIGCRQQNIDISIRKVKQFIGKVVQVSSIYETEAWGNPNQRAFYNQIILVLSLLSPEEMLMQCQHIEAELGPSKQMEWGARIIDLDILFFGDEIINTENLVIPHPRIHERRFVLEPICEIFPDLVHPILEKDMKTILAESSDTLIVKKLEHIKKDITLKYQFIAIEGNIGAGKTTFAQMLSKKYDLKLILEEFSDNPFLPYFYQEPERYAFPVELFFMTERHKQLQKNLMQQSMFSNGVIADYFFLKTLLFAGNNLTQEELRLFQRLFKILNASFPQPDILVYLHRPIDILLQQIKKRGRSYEMDISKDYLIDLQNTYLDYFQTVNDYPVILIELGDLDFKENPFVFEKLVDIFNQNFENGFHKIAL